MKAKLFIMTYIIMGTALYAQDTIDSQNEKRYFLPAIGENLLSNTLLHVTVRFSGAHWAQVTSDSIRENLTSPWVWDRDEYFINQFGHPYQGSTYHAAARANGFSFYESIFFDAFGSTTWELFAETNAPSINDLISTTLGGASLGEMFHRLYLEIPSPFAVLVSPVDAFNGLVTRRRPLRQTKNIYSLLLRAGIAYTYAEQSMEQNKDSGLIKMNSQNIASTDIYGHIVYGDPFLQQSKTPYNHFELSAYASFGIPLWYNLKILSDGYLFSFPAINNETTTASTGLTLHYDIFSDRHIDFFSEAFDWTFKYRHKLKNNLFMEVKAHLGWTVFSADTFYIQNEYAAGLRKTKNNYGTGFNSKLFFSVYYPKRWTFKMGALVYRVVNVFQSEYQSEYSTKDDPSFWSLDMDFTRFIHEHFGIGIGGSFLRNDVFYVSTADTRKRTNIVRLYAEWNIK